MLRLAKVATPFTAFTVSVAGMPTFTRARSASYASPDSTYAVTRRLLDRARRSLLIGIYDFSAEHVKELLLARDRRVVSVTPKNLPKYLGVKRFRYGRAEENDQVGQVTGLAWTEVGGELLTIEAAVVPGKGKLLYTGQLGEVMQESIQAAMTVVRSRANVLGLEPEFYQKADVHIHVPEGATPKDGPSAGIGMCTALVSALTKVPVRADVAMTGEITLRGEVLPIGGLKEKLLAAHRGGIKTVLIPEENAKDLTEISESIKGGLEIIPVSRMDEVLNRIAVVMMPTMLYVCGKLPLCARVSGRMSSE